MIELRRNCGIRGNESGGRILPEGGIGTGMRNILDGGATSGKVSSAQSPPG
ncbi:hypothetical protein A2U01_0070364 [Trifolium medium]|uniref:Uncharacterized protein n=1 Tax=Trifolium medium TaxID=97028 RepID=A0A392SJS2_9FABA|nr:hypothetical protein [Trifolium medium]